MFTRMRSLTLTTLLLTALALSIASCVIVGEYPPRHPHDGYVYTSLGVELVYASDLDVYYVSHHPGSYYYDGNYYRRQGDRWETAHKWDGQWKECSRDELPPGLAKRR